MHELIAGLNPLLLLTAVIVTGMIAGSAKIKGFSLESSAIIFVGMFAGHLGGQLPLSLQSLGLLLFIYSIGLQAGPGFLSSFRSDGLKLSIGALLLVATGFLITLIGSYVLGYSGDTASGVFAGSLTSSPGLAVAVELSGPGKAPAAYGLTYIFGVIGVILFIKFLPIITKKNIRIEEDKVRQTIDSTHEKLEVFHILVTNPNIEGKSISELNITALAPVSLTRLTKKGEKDSLLITGDTQLNNGDLLRIVGSQENVDKMLYAIGELTDKQIQNTPNLDSRRILVSKKEVTGQSLASLHLREIYNVTISRLNRNGIDFPVQSHIELQIGDRLTIVGSQRSLNKVEKYLGNDIEATFTADAIGLVAGLLIGILIGSIPITIPNVTTFKLGMSGGVLCAGLILGGIYNTKGFVWALPVPTNNFIRGLGLYIFLAVVGVSAGSTIVQTIHSQGVALLLLGIGVTSLTLIIGGTLCSYFLKIPFLRLLGVIAGGMTSTPGLAASTNMTNTSYIASAYATVYPAAMIGMIFFTKLLVYLLP